MINGRYSYWLSGPTSPEPPETERIDGDLTTDVAIIGGGISGLWTAWALLQRDPSLSVAVFEAEKLAFGASGRNAGLLSTKPVGLRRVLATRPGGRDGVIAMERVLQRGMHDIVDILGADNIHAHHGGWLQLARSPSERRRIEALVATHRSWGVTEDELRVLSAAEVTERIKVDRVVGGIFSPDNYAIDPARMVFTLADLVTKAGARIFTQARATSWRPGELVVAGNRVTARQIVVATEGYTCSQPGQKRRMLPMNSSQLVTEPLTDEQWAKIGWAGFESMAGTAHSHFYSKRTHDGRIAIGGRGKPYRFNSGFDHNGELDADTIRSLTALLADLLPQVELRPAHAWCGVLGVSRDWSPFVDFSSDTGIVRMGGYVGQGLTAAHVAGQIVADLLTGRDTELARSAWVRPVPMRWEPEPLRWIGANGLYRAYAWADVLERRSGTPKTSVIATAADRLARR